MTNKKITWISLVSGILILLSVAGAQPKKEKTDLPIKIQNLIHIEIQKQMSYALKGENRSTIWTPHQIELQQLTGETTHTLDVYSPHQIIYRLTYDVGMGTQMDDTIAYWRQCGVQILQAGDEWSPPIVDCDTTQP